MFVSTKQMLLDAQAGHYAVGAFNIENLEFVMAVIKAAEERRSVILQTSPGTVNTPTWFSYRNGSRSSNEASVPVALHLTTVMVDRCIQAARVVTLPSRLMDPTCL